jgi:hypothetical protein
MPNFLLLNGPHNGRYATLADAYDMGYDTPDSDTAYAWNEPVLVYVS